MSLTYTLADFPDSQINPENLASEIRASPIVTALDYVSTSGSTVYIVFKATLSSGDKTLLDGDTTAPAGGLIAAHDYVDKTPDPPIFQVLEEHGKTNGKFISDARWIEAPTGVSSTDIQFELPTSVMEIQFITTAENVDDSVNLYVFRKDTGFGEGVIGAITSTVSSGATGIPVSQTIVDSVYTGDYISLKEGGKEEDLGLIKSIDKTAKILYMKTPTATSFSAASPSLVKWKRYVLKQFPLGPPWKIDIGSSKIGGSYVSTDYTVRIEYTNNGNSAKRLYSVIERLE
jgi:hypothetical protein